MNQVTEEHDGNRNHLLDHAYTHGQRNDFYFQHDFSDDESDEILKAVLKESLGETNCNNCDILKVINKHWNLDN